MNLRINADRPIDELVGVNRFGIRRRLANIHCMTPLYEAVRQVRPKQMRTVPPALRRGLVKCVADTLDEYRATYIHVACRSQYDPSKAKR